MAFSPEQKASVADEVSRQEQMRAQRAYGDAQAEADRLLDLLERIKQVLKAEGKTVMMITHSVEEAIYLANRVVIISARPSRIRRMSIPSVARNISSECCAVSRRPAAFIRGPNAKPR